MAVKFIEITTDQDEKELINSMYIIRMAPHGSRTLLYINQQENSKIRQLYANESYEDLKSLLV